jgi:cytochrome c biogenesis protein CcdA
VMSVTIYVICVCLRIEVSNTYYLLYNGGVLTCVVTIINAFQLFKLEIPEPQIFFNYTPRKDSLGGYVGIGLSVCLSVCPGQLPHLLSDFHQTVLCGI